MTTVITGDGVGSSVTGDGVGSSVTGDGVGSSVTGDGVGSSVTGEGLGGSVLHVSTYSQDPLITDPIPKFTLQHATRVAYESDPSTKMALEQTLPSKKKT